MRAVVAYPGVMAAASEVARAFVEAGSLARYETTVAYCAGAWPDRIARAVAVGLFGARVDRQLNRRDIAGLPHERVRRTLTWEALRIVASRIGADAVIGDRLWEQMIERFDIGVARRLGHDVDLIYGYEHACQRSFERAAELGMKRVLDMAAPHYSFTDAVLGEEARGLPEIVTAQWKATRPLAEVRNARKQAEFDTAQLVIANSSFTARTLLQTGYAPDKVRVVPLGAPPVDPSWRANPIAPVTRFLFAGSISPRKGAHHLLAAWRALGRTAGAELVLAGEWALPERLGAQLPSSVKVLGRVPQNELFALYRSASALVFPSVCDGFGMVVTEALAHGLPVITTHNVGASDLLRDGVNGWVLPVGDVDALVAKLTSCLEHPGDLRAMREHAEATAAAHPWSEYRKRLMQVVAEL
jgi:glycosyltransferase involved in cell wall biosynthesis